MTRSVKGRSSSSATTLGAELIAWTAATDRADRAPFRGKDAHDGEREDEGAEEQTCSEQQQHVCHTLILVSRDITKPAAGQHARAAMPSRTKPMPVV